MRPLYSYLLTSANRPPQAGAEQVKSGNATAAPDGLATTDPENNENDVENTGMVKLPEFGGTGSVIGGAGMGSAPLELKLMVTLVVPNGSPL